MITETGFGPGSGYSLWAGISYRLNAWTGTTLKLQKQLLTEQSVFSKRFNIILAAQSFGWTLFISC